MKLWKLLITMMTIILLSTTAYAKKYTIKVNNQNFTFNSKAELELYNEYDSKLWGMPYLANELVKGKAEYIENIIQTKRLDRYKTKAKKISKAEGSWNSIMRQFLTNKESSGYRRIPVQSPEFTKYVVENFDELMKNENISMPISLIKDNYDIIVKTKLQRN